jgi:hypothetical protein
MTDSCDSLAVSFYAWNSPLICQENWSLCLGYCAAYYEYAHAFLKVNKLFKGLTITAGAHSVSLLL